MAFKVLTYLIHLPRQKVHIQFIHICRLNSPYVLVSRHLSECLLQLLSDSFVFLLLGDKLILQSVNLAKLIIEQNHHHINRKVSKNLITPEELNLKENQCYKRKLLKDTVLHTERAMGIDYINAQKFTYIYKSSVLICNPEEIERKCHDSL